jgi:hypothetical protein
VESYIHIGEINMIINNEKKSAVRAKRAAYDRTYKDAHKEKIKEQMKVYREANKEKIAAYYKEYNRKEKPMEDKMSEDTEIQEVKKKVLTPDKVVTYLQLGRCYQSVGLSEYFKTDPATIWSIMNFLESRGLVKTIRGSGSRKLWEKCEPKEIITTTPTTTKQRYFGEYYV